MATIDDAIRSGVLEVHRLAEWYGGTPLRSLLVAPQLYEWSDGTPEMTSEKCALGGRLLVEHFDQVLGDMRCAKKPAGGDLQRIEPQHQRVWKLKAPGIRIFGWFHRRSEFVAVTGELKARLKAAPELHDVKRDEVLAFAKENGLISTMMKGDLREVI